MLIIIERRSVDKVTLTCKVLKQKQIISNFKYIYYMCLSGSNHETRYIKI